MYGFEYGTKDRRVLDFLSIQRQNELYWPVLQPSVQRHYTADKWMLDCFMRAASVRTAETYGLLHPDFGVTREHESLQTAEDFRRLLWRHRPRSLIMKPRGGGGGNLVFRFDPVFDGESVWLEASGVRLEVEEALQRVPLRACSNEIHGWLIQERVIQHAELDRLNASSLNTARLISFLTKKGDCQIQAAIMRIGRQGKVIDNWSRGGVAAAVDVETGILGSGVLKAEDGVHLVESHPDSGERLAGFQVPFWRESVELVGQMARHFSGVKSIGWDVAITPEGPVLIEGNNRWGLRSLQAHGKGYLSKEVRRELKRYGVEFPTRWPSLGASLRRMAWDRLNKLRPKPEGT